VGVSVIDGWLPIVVAVLGVAGLAFLLIRPFRWWWIWVVPPVVVLSGLAAWAIGRFAAPSYVGEELKPEIVLWIALGFIAIGLAIGYMFKATWWQRVLAVVAAIFVLAAAGNQINKFYVQYPRLGDLLGVGADSQINGPPVISTGPSPSTSPTLPAGPLTTTWTPTGSDIPADGKGKTSTIDLPGTASGFTGRPGQVYYPPAYFADNPQPLPVMILIAGQPGDPGDWFLGDRVQNVMNDFAAAHHGIAPIVVVPDALGSTLANPDCLDSSLGNVDTYLSKDVPDGIKKQLRVDQDTTHWVIGGFSYGGICSLQLATNHPDIYRNFIDISGLEDATLDIGQRQQTIDKIFGGNEAKFKAINPKDIMSGKKFPDTSGWFIAGSEDNDTNPGQQRLNKIAQAAGMDTQFWESPGTGHDWATAVNGLTHTMPWSAKQMNLTG
jgi:enterochelin esterase-like enzyme